MRKPRKIIIIAIAISATVAGVFLLGGPHIGRYFQQKYFHEAYKPQELETQAIGSSPSEYQIKGIPWISYEKSYCQSTALQMIAYKHGLKPSLGYLNFLTGFTYGAFYPGDPIGFLPYNDPIPGCRLAVPYLGLEMKYLITDDSDSFLNALRFYLSREYPVGIQLNAAMLWDEEGFFPHSELLEGYDESGFYYFETVKEDRFTEEAEGLKVTDQLLIEAVAEVNKELARPRKFALTIFEKGERKEDLSEIWTRNGEALVGSKQGPVAGGAVAIKEFASKLKGEGEIKNLWALEALSYTRLDNAVFLEQYFADDKEIKEAAQLLRKADEYYDQALEIAEGDIKSKEKANQVAELLIMGASLEEEAGKIFISKGEMLH